MTMSRQDFELVARAVNRALNTGHASTASDDFVMGYGIGMLSVIGTLADELTRTNPAFDRARFVRACQVRPDEQKRK